MPKKNGANQKFPGYEKSYIGDLLKIVNRDVQDNSQIGSTEYLYMVADSCEKFNQDFGEEVFDDRGNLSD